jgi:hypothetical protein
MRRLLSASFVTLSFLYMNLASAEPPTVHVELRSEEPDTALYRYDGYAGDSHGPEVMWKVLCFAPCAADLVATTDLPPFTSSAMDGWAVCGPPPWTVVGEVLAGGAGAGFVGTLAPGRAVRIATGAALPAGAEAIVRSEHGTLGATGSEQLDLAAGIAPPVPGQDVRAAATECRAGDVVATAVTNMDVHDLARIGKTYGHLMVDLNTYACRKLVDRGTRVVATATGLDYAAAAQLLHVARGRVKTALIMHHLHLPRAQADSLLTTHAGRVREALRAPHPKATARS